MKKKFKETILEQAVDWFESGQKVVIARVIQTWGSSPCPTGSKMIVNDKGDFFGSVSGGCVESNVINECLKLIKNKILFKQLDFKVSDENAWDVGLACGGEIKIYIEQINL
tara:strand:+ start:266 stop:598 length:333 start_codon:yes stop_codon:yes gene_type:complete